MGSAAGRGRVVFFDHISSSISVGLKIAHTTLHCWHPAEMDRAILPWEYASVRRILYHHRGWILIDREPYIR